MTEFVTPKPVKQSRPPVICSVIFHTVNHGTLSFPDIHSLLFHFPVFPNSLRLEFGQNINKMYSPDVQNYSAFFRFHFRFQENAQHQWAQLKKKYYSFNNFSIISTLVQESAAFSCPVFSTVTFSITSLSPPPPPHLFMEVEFIQLWEHPAHAAVSSAHQDTKRHKLLEKA